MIRDPWEASEVTALPRMNISVLTWLQMLQPQKQVSQQRGPFLPNILG